MRFFYPIILFFLLLQPHLSFSQFFSWTRGGGSIENDEFRAVAPLNNSIYFGGITTANSGNFIFENDTFQTQLGQDAFIGKINNSGEARWIFPIVSNGFESVNTILADASGNLFVGGGIESQVQFGPNLSANTGKSFYVAAFDTLGQNQWIFTADSNFSNAQAEITAIAEQGANIIVGGFFNDSLKIGNTKYTSLPLTKTPIIVSLTKTGSVNWVKILSVGASSNLNDLTTDANGNIYVGGNFRNSIQVDNQTLNASGKTDIFLLKLNANGSLVRLIRYGSTEHETINTLAVHQGNLVVGGAYRLNLTMSGLTISSALNTSAFYAIGDTTFTFTSLQKIGGSTTDEIKAVDISVNNKIAVGGVVGENPIIKGAAIVNFKQTGFILLVDLNNNLIKRRVFDVNSNQEVTHTKFIDNEQLTVCGNFIGTTTFEPYGQLSTRGKKDIFITKMRDCVGQVPAPLAYLTNDSLCKGDTIKFSTSNAPNKTYKWLRNGSIIPNETGSVLAVTDAGNYRTIVNFDGCEDTSKVLRATFLPQPTVAIDVFPITCEGADSLVLTQGKPAGGVYSGQGVVNGVFGPNIGVGTYPITYTFTNIQGCSDSATRNFTVGTIPTVNFPPLPTLCSFDTLLNLNSATPKGGTYSGVGVVNNRFNSAVGYGNWEIVYTYTTSYGCTNTDTSSVFVDSLPYISLNNVGRVCLFNGPFTLDNSDPTTGVYSGPAITGNVFDPTQTGLGTFFHTYTVTAPSGCSSSRVASVTVVDAPKPQLPDSAFICQLQSLQLTTTDTVYPYYFWEYGGGSSSFGDFQPGSLPLGNNYVSVVVTDSLGCQGTDSIFVEVSACQTVNVYPNPSVGEINVSFSSVTSGQARLWLINAQGQRLMDKEITYQIGENIYFFDDFSSYSGIYTLVIVFDDYYLHQPIMLINQF